MAETTKETKPKGDATPTPAPEHLSTNVSNQDPDSVAIGPGSPVTRTNSHRASILGAAPTEAASNVTQVKGGLYLKYTAAGPVWYNGKGLEVDENGKVIERDDDY